MQSYNDTIIDFIPGGPHVIKGLFYFYNYQRYVLTSSGCLSINMTNSHVTLVSINTSGCRCKESDILSNLKFVSLKLRY